MIKASNIILVFTAFTISIFVSAQSGHEDAKTEVVLYSLCFYDTIGNQMEKTNIRIPQKIWLKDSISIEEIAKLNIESTDGGPETYKISLLFYRFTNLRTDEVYEYGSFTDTATLIKKYFYTNPQKMPGGWNFKFNRQVTYNGEPENLQDTTIDRISYKRMRLNRSIENYPCYMDCYFRCDKKGTAFDKNPALSKIAGCPLVKTFNYFPLKNSFPTSGEIEFLSDTLTTEESKVFDAWEKRALENPVKQ